jgi:UPF0716 protein FxsA
LVTPGFITDIVGLLFTIPFTRAPIAASLVKSFMTSGKGQASFSFHQQGFHGSASSNFHQKNEDGSVFDAEYVDKTDASKSTDNRANIDYKDQVHGSSDSSSSESKNDSLDKDDEKNR